MKLAPQYLKKIEKQLGELGNKIDELNAKVKAETKSRVNETSESLHAQMDEAFKKVNDSIDSQLNEWGLKIEKLKGKAKEEAKEEYEEMLKNIQPRVEEFRGTINELKKSSGDAWTDIKTGAVNAWKEMKNSLNSAISKFK